MGTAGRATGCSWASTYDVAAIGMREVREAQSVQSVGRSMLHCGSCGRLQMGTLQKGFAAGTMAYALPPFTVSGLQPRWRLTYVYSNSLGLT